MRPIPFRPLAAALVLCCAPLPALPQSQPQVHQKSSEHFVLRSSVVNSLSVPESGAAASGIERSAETGILNVTVLRKGSNLTETVPASVDAYAVDLSDARRQVHLRETRNGDWISYSGTFRMAPREVLEFHIRARPAGSAETLEMSYRERVWVNRTEP